jgi:hypothetical protein
MPLYMDIHYKIAGLTAEGLAEAHKRDVQCQGKHGVNWLSYWYSVDTGRAYCMYEAPDAESGEACHREAHGIIADEITEVDKGA